MINCYKITDAITLNKFLTGFGLSAINSWKLQRSRAFTNDKGYVMGLDILENENLYINFSLLESSSVEPDYANPPKLEIIYEDQDIIAVFKRRGILVHSDGTGTKTLLDEVNQYLVCKGDDSVVRSIHRLDFNTTGIVVYSKNILAHANISMQLEKMEVEKEYYAVVEGIINEDGFINIGIGKNRHDSRKMIAIESGRDAYTEYKVLKHINGNTLVSVKIKTGRTHQIRVHMSYINHPVVGDSLYGNKGTLMLMCKRMSFNLLGKRVNIITEKELI